MWAKNLTNVDGLFGKSDPFVVVYVKPGKEAPGVPPPDLAKLQSSPAGFVAVAKTEVIDNNLNPRWRPLDVVANLLDTDEILFLLLGKFPSFVLFTFMVLNFALSLSPDDDKKKYKPLGQCTSTIAAIRKDNGAAHSLKSSTGKSISGQFFIQIQ